MKQYFLVVQQTNNNIPVPFIQKDILPSSGLDPIKGNSRYFGYLGPTGCPKKKKLLSPAQTTQELDNRDILDMPRFHYSLIIK